jgi:chromosomal replication initiator protein
LNSIWQQCISCLEGEISEQQLNTWILPLQVEQELNTLKLLAPNRFVMDWVRKHFLDRIRELVTNLDDSKSMSVSLMIGSHAGAAKPDPVAATPLPRTYRSSGVNESQKFKTFVDSGQQ